MTTNATFETNDKNLTGARCLESGYYLCKMHPYIEKYIQEGDTFPQCDQKSLSHDTIWFKIVERH